MTRVLVLGAAGLIGHALASDCRRAGLAVTAVARRFAPGQRFDESIDFRETPLVGVGPEALGALLDAARPDVVVNTIGVLGDGPDASARDVHAGFVDDLLAALAGRGAYLVHVSVPGEAVDDRTPFSRTKRAAEVAIARSGQRYAILRPGFVLADNAFGGSALLRALAGSGLDLSSRERRRPFRPVAMADVSRTVVQLAERHASGSAPATATWDLMSAEPVTLGDIVDALRDWLGAPRGLALPAPLLDLGARCGDLAVRLGWRPPVRSAALAELRRGVTGDPAPWTTATGIAPLSLRAMLAARPATIQERWFAPLYGLKAVTVATLAAFWIVSGLVALTLAYEPARQMLTAAGFGDLASHVVTLATGAADVAVGVAIALRRTCRLGLLAGIAVTLFYLVSITALAPAMWLDPVGAVVKTVPILVLMLVALALLRAR